MSQQVLNLKKKKKTITVVMHKILPVYCRFSVDCRTTYYTLITKKLSYIACFYSKIFVPSFSTFTNDFIFAFENIT